MFLHGHYQNAYVTRDLDAAMAALTKRYGLKDYIVFEPDMVLKTAEGDKNASVRAALAWDGGLQFELIQPVSGFNDHYLSALSSEANDKTPAFHHIAVRRDNLAAMREEIAQLGFPIAFEGEVPGLMVFIYVDAREMLGHFIEFMWATEEGWAMQGWPKGRRPD